MNWLDYALIAVFAIGVVIGMLTGPLWQAYRVFSVVLSIIAAFLLNKIVIVYLNGTFSPETAGILGYAIVFVAVLILTYVIGRLLKFFFIKRKFGISGRLFGGGIGFLKTIVICSAIILVVPHIENNKAKEVVNGSLIATNLDKGARMVVSTVSKNLKNKSFVEKKMGVEE